MSHVEGVVRTLLSFRETADSSPLAKRVEAPLPAGDDLVGVGLMPHVPDEAVPRRVEDVVEGEREFYRSQGGGEMAAPL